MACRLEEDPALSALDQRRARCQSVDAKLAMKEYLRMEEVRGDCSIERTRNFEKGIIVLG